MLAKNICTLGYRIFKWLLLHGCLITVPKKRQEYVLIDRLTPHPVFKAPDPFGERALRIVVLVVVRRKVVESGSKE